MSQGENMIIVRHESKKAGRIDFPLWLNKANMNKVKKGFKDRISQIPAIKSLSKNEIIQTLKLANEMASKIKDRQKRGGWVGALLPILASLAPAAIDLAAKYGPKLVKSVGDEIQKMKDKKRSGGMLKLKPLQSAGRVGSIDIPMFTAKFKKIANGEPAELSDTRKAVKAISSGKPGKKGPGGVRKQPLNDLWED